jgi:hypothetical protein
LGTLALIANLPATGNPGDGYIVTEDGGHLWIWDSLTSSWDDVGAIVGPQGATGPTGPQGIWAYTTLPTSADPGDAWFDPETGKAFIYYDGYWVEVGAAPAGPTGPQGPQGLVGPTGPQGLQGPTGPAGTGTAGSADLATTWWLGF